VARGVFILFTSRTTENGHGTLRSIGLGGPRYLPLGRPLGWIVPDGLKANWDLHIGDFHSHARGYLASVDALTRLVEKKRKS